MAYHQTSNGCDEIAYGLSTWIAELRDRVERGELISLVPVVIERGVTVPADLAAKLALADLDHFDDLPVARREHPDLLVRRRLILHDLQALREQLG